MKLGELAAHLGCPVEGNPDVEIRGLASIQQAGPGELSFIESEKYARFIKLTRAEALILDWRTPVSKVPCIRSEQPRLTFARALELFYQPRRPAPGIHPTAILGANVHLGENVHVGAHVVIGDAVTLGPEAVIYPNCTIYNDVRIGARTVVHANCVLHERTEIGDECIIQSGVVVGGEGFGFVPTPEGTWHKMPQSGYVRVEDQVEIGSNAAVDRPSVGFTHIGRGTKIDNLVMVGHGCEIGEHCLLVGQVGLAGGVKLGRNVVLAGQVGVAGHAAIGDRTVVSAQSGIPSDVEPGTVVSGSPALPHALWLRTSALIRRLPELFQNLRDLQRKVALLQQRLDSGNH
ncbi:MAG: UDP-3-O-(3-hydroxymyristoyl)glucosamine N-acyltransferase [Aphanocapsa lilacina HA4352-LM1]|jgi:UDP-3-O-[3-hydroxymyristoyl] glucosamine N-acyltransferase|nr:UDP-3-O-(3-hydroxymyristoyl)glucosamine N-acyltransferase [Aphanocapsa lilacina HA4352-LM1]